jgi:hypothetical protein
LSLRKATQYSIHGAPNGPLGRPPRVHELSAHQIARASSLNAHTTCDAHVVEEQLAIHLETQFPNRAVLDALNTFQKAPGPADLHEARRNTPRQDTEDFGVERVG